MAQPWGQPDRKQLGGFFDAVFRIKFDDNTKVIAPQCLRQVTPGVGRDDEDDMIESEFDENLNAKADFLVELINEVVFFVNKIGEEDSQPMRRAFCRSVFQFVDGIASDLKADVFSYESPELIGEHYYLALQDKKIISKGGKGKIIKYRSGFAKNILFAFDIYSWTAGVDVDLRENSREWNRFMRCITIRNKVVHPKTLMDMEVSKKDVIEMLKMFIWLKETLLNVHEQVGSVWLKMAESVKSTFSAQPSASLDRVGSGTTIKDK